MEHGMEWKWRTLILSCNTGQDVELQDTHTQHQDEGGNPKQPTIF